MTEYDQDVEMTQGNDRTIEITVKDEAGVVVDITNASITWGFVERGGDGTILATKTVDSGITITDAVHGVFEVALEPADTAEFYGDYIHEVEVVDQYNHVFTATVGTLTIHKRNVTAPAAP